MRESPTSLSSPSPSTLHEGAAAEVMFRAPHSATYTRLVQHTQPRTFLSLQEVPACSGYLIVPFRTTAEAPIVLVEPDEAYELPLEMAANAAPPEASDDTAAQRTRYADAFRTAHGSLLRGKVEKVVLSRRLNLRWNDETLPTPEHLFFKACQDNPNCFVAMWNTAHTGRWLVASPEPLLEKSNHTWGSVALAGTMPHAEGTENSWSEKNIAEQAIVQTLSASNSKPVPTTLSSRPPSRSLRASSSTSAPVSASRFPPRRPCSACSNVYTPPQQFVACHAKPHWT